MPYCAKFKDQIPKLENALVKAKSLLQNYLETGEGKIADEIQENLKDIFDMRSEFKARVKEVLTKLTGFSEDDFEITNYGHTFFKKPLVFVQGPKHFAYWPKMIKKLSTLQLPGGGTVPKLDSFSQIESIEGDLKLGDSRGVGRAFYIRGREFGSSPNSMTFDNLKEVGGDVILNFNERETFFNKASKLEKAGSLTIPVTIKNFKEAFPKLKKIGKNQDRVSVSIFEPRMGLAMSRVSVVEQAKKLKSEIEELINKGELKIDGYIKSIYYE